LLFILLSAIVQTFTPIKTFNLSSRGLNEFDFPSRVKVNYLLQETQFKQENSGFRLPDEFFGTFTIDESESFMGSFREPLLRLCRAYAYIEVHGDVEEGDSKTVT
jgi:hypothetical protein